MFENHIYLRIQIIYAHFVGLALISSVSSYLFSLSGILSLEKWKNCKKAKILWITKINYKIHHDNACILLNPDLIFWRNTALINFSILLILQAWHPVILVFFPNSRYLKVRNLKRTKQKPMRRNILRTLQKILWKMLLGVKTLPGKSYYCRRRLLERR